MKPNPTGKLNSEGVIVETPNSSPIRVLLADDSATTRTHLAQMIEDAPGLQLVGAARDGEEAVRMVEALHPDVVSMDIRMPRMDGLEATRQIMARQPTPTVVVSGLIDEDVDLSFRAMEAGALAVLRKPPARQSPDHTLLRRQFINTLTAMAGVSVVRRWNDTGPLTEPASRVEPPSSDAATRYVTPEESALSTPEIIAIGASAGGPSALCTLLGDLPSTFRAPILIVQHMPDEFVSGLARWLGKHTELNITVAEHGETLQPGSVYIAPGAKHLTVVRRSAQLQIKLIPNEDRYRYCPAIDVLLASVTEVCGTTGVGIILTGMGEDGAAGLLALRQAGGRTFAQSEASCTVFGMPGAALARGAVEQTLTPAHMAEVLRQL
ncbi:MAG: chemotaxis-specific protein-glutamate methyltransferase CheB [Anaerolineae bacterium]